MRFALLVVSSLAFTTACPPAPSEGEGEGDEGEGEGEPAVDFGFVIVTSEPTLGFAQAVAVFRREQRFAFDCEEREVAGCVVLECGDELPSTPVNAGPIDVEGALSPIALTFTAGDGYGAVTPKSPTLFLGGEQITATAPGDVAPAFSLSVTAPPSVNIDEPAWPAQQDVLPIVRADGFALAWSTSNTGDVRAVFNSFDLSVEVTCTFPADAGTATIPAEALLELPAGDGFLDVELRATATERIDTWQIELAAITHAQVGIDPAIASITLD